MHPSRAPGRARPQAARPPRPTVSRRPEQSKVRDGATARRHVGGHQGAKGEAHQPKLPSVGNQHVESAQRGGQQPFHRSEWRIVGFAIAGQGAKAPPAHSAAAPVHELDFLHGPQARQQRVVEAGHAAHGHQATTPSAARTPCPSGKHEDGIDRLPPAARPIARPCTRRPRSHPPAHRRRPPAEAVELRPGLQVARHGQRFVPVEALCAGSSRMVVSLKSSAVTSAHAQP